MSDERPHRSHKSYESYETLLQHLQGSYVFSSIYAFLSSGAHGGISVGHHYYHSYYHIACQLLPTAKRFVSLVVGPSYGRGLSHMVQVCRNAPRHDLCLPHVQVVQHDCGIRIHKTGYGAMCKVEGSLARTGRGPLSCGLLLSYSETSFRVDKKEGPFFWCLSLSGTQIFSFASIGRA